METFERKVPKELWKHVHDAGYARVEPARRREWLESHFFLPGGWPECPDVARVESVTRVRKHCWDSIRDMVVIESTGKRGRPSADSKRRQVLYHLIHAQRPLLPEWQWPLVMLALKPDELSAGERLWLMAREGVLSPVLARLFCMELAIFCADLTRFDRGSADAACDLISVGFNANRSVRTVRRQLVHLLPAENEASLVFLEIVGGSPVASIRRTLAQATRVARRNSLTLAEIKRVFAAALGPVITERNF